MEGTKFSDRMQTLLNYSGLSQKDFSEKIGVTPVAINNYLRLERVPSLDVVLKIIQSFPELNANWLLTGRGVMTIEDIPINRSVKEYQDLLHKYRGLSYDIRKLTSIKENIALLTEVSTLKDTIIKLQTDNALLSNEVTALRTENNALKERIKRLEGKEV